MSKIAYSYGGYESSKGKGTKVPFCVPKIVLFPKKCYYILIEGGNMYIIRLDTENGDMFKVLYDYEGFKATLKLEEATKFKTLEEARSVLESMSIRKIYNEPQIEKVK